MCMKKRERERRIKREGERDRAYDLASESRSVIISLALCISQVSVKQIKVRSFFLREKKRDEKMKRNEGKKKKGNIKRNLCVSLKTPSGSPQKIQVIFRTLNLDPWFIY